jgi:drug/metabolite transporter (DMT)-like permease
LLAALGYGVSDFVGGVASRRVAALRVVIVSYPVSVAVALLSVPFLRGSPSTAALLWGAGAGVVGGLAIWWFYRALAAGPMSVVSPLTGVFAAGIPVLVGLVSGERPRVLAYIGIALALVAVVLASRDTGPGSAGLDAGTDRGPGRPRFTAAVALPTLGAGIAFACDFMALHQIGGGAGMWPMVVSRTSATAVGWTAALSGRQFAPPAGRTRWLACGAGVMDVSANAAMMYAYHGGLLSLVTVIGALYPASTVLLAMVVLGERLGRAQQVGMLLALAAVGLIATA